MEKIPGTYYLAHPLLSRKDVREWELYFESKTGISLFNPFYDVYREDIDDLDKGILNPRKGTASEVVERDLKHLNKQEGLFCLVDGNQSVGIYQEMIYGFLAGKIIHTVITNEKMRQHPWLVYHSHKIFSDLNGFENFVTHSI